MDLGLPPWNAGCCGCLEWEAVDTLTPEFWLEFWNPDITILSGLPHLSGRWTHGFCNKEKRYLEALRVA